MIPNSPEQRVKLNTFIERALVLVNEKKVLDEDLAELKAEVEHDLGKDIAKEFKNMYKVAAEKEKVLTSAEVKLDILAELDILAHTTLPSEEAHPIT